MLARVAGAALGRDVEVGSDQSHAAAEAGQLHSNPLLPKLVCSAFSRKHGSPVSGSHISPNVSTLSYAVDVPSSVKQVLAVQTFPSLCLTNLNFSG